MTRYFVQLYRPMRLSFIGIEAGTPQAGYRWNPADRVWTHPIHFDSALGMRIEAEQLYQEVRQMIREEKGIAPDQGVPF